MNFSASSGIRTRYPRIAVAVVVLLSIAALLALSFPRGALAVASPQKTMVSIVHGASALTNTAYSPDTVTVVIGVNNTVVWTNNDATSHTVTGTSPAFNVGTINPGKSGNFTFTQAGTYNYHCAIHPTMTGQVIVLAATSGSTSTTGSSGGGIPEFPIQALTVVLFTAMVLAAYLTVRHRALPGTPR